MKYSFTVLLFFFIVSSHAQDENIPGEAIVYKDSVVDTKPQFPGGIDDCYKYFAKKIKLPEVSSLVDKVVLTFIVETDGSLTDIRVIHDAGFGTGDQVATILESGPKWIPGKKDGIPVRVFQRLPIPIVTGD